MAPYWQIMKCPDGFGWEGNFTHGHCEPCEPGHYSDRWGFGMKSRCIPCEPQWYDSSREQNSCQEECEYGTTFKTGATEESDCVNPDDMFGKGSFQSEVAVKVKLTGDWTFLNDVLMEASGINFYHARASVEYHEEDHISSLHVSAMLPNNIAVHAHNFMLQFRDFKDFFNDYAMLGDHFSRIIFDMLNNAETFKEFGWKMNHDQLRVKNVKILDVAVHLNQHCEHGYRSVEWEGVGTKCVEDTQAHSALEKSWYIQYVGESEDCDTLGGEARLRHFVENSWPFPCLEDGECEAHFATCKTLMSGECAITIHLIFHDNEAGKGDMETNVNKARRVEYHGDTSFEYSEDHPYITRETCGVDPKINGDGSTRCSEESKCDSENGYRLTRSGNCEQCPYGTWFDRESIEVFQRCQSCRFSKSVTIYNVVPKREDDCLNGGYWPEQNSDGVWMDEGEYVGVELEYSADATVELQLCRIIDVKHKFEEYCADRMSMEDMSLDDFTDYNVEMLGCLVMEEFSEIYEHSCDGFSKSWSDIMDDFYWQDVACFVAKGIHTIENDEGECDNLSEDKQHLSMPFEFDEDIMEYDHFGWSSALWVPLFSNIEKMDRFRMDTVSKTVEGVFHKFGMYDMAKLTGLHMMDYVRDMILAVPRGLSVTDTNFDLQTTDDDIYCDNGNVRAQCWSSSVCHNRQCNNDGYNEDDLYCDGDPCNDCEPFWTYQGSPVECEDPKKSKCEVETEIANGKLLRIHPGQFNDGIDVCEGCEDSVDTYEYVCNEGYRLDNAETAEDGSGSYYGDGFECDTKLPYCKSTDNTISREPKCVPDNCNYDDLENGYIVEVNAKSNSACRSAEYRCNQGYKMEGSKMVFCNVDGSKTDMPTCVEDRECQFPEKIENGRFIGEYHGWDGRKRGWYQCQHGTRDYGDVYFGESCDDSEYSSSCRMDTNCPVEIEHGYLMREWEWEEYETYIGEYRCYEGFELRNPSIFSSSKADYEEHYGWGTCGYDGDFDPENLPRCVKPGSPEPCNMPKETLNGYRVEEMMNEEYGMIDQAKYKCNSGYMMVETWKGDIGWCRHDGTFELPYCMSPREWFTVEFELVPGLSKMENAGRVKARHVYADGSADDWYAGCDDHFNGPAAGAICRSMGFRHGKQITGDKKMKPISDLPFGMTNIYCYHDDTLIMR